jgi:NitT/TauT family transport system substrate-binding protein
MAKPKLILLLFICVAIAVQTAACQPAVKPTPTPQPIKLKVVILPYISFAPYFIAQEEGFFAEQALEVEMVEIARHQDSVAALIGGDVDIWGGLLTAGLINSIARGANIRIVADKGYIDPDSCANIALIARKTLLETGKAPDAKTLRGANIVNVPGSWNEYYTDKLLNTLDLSVTDLQNNNIPAAGQVEALNQGTLDLVVNNEPWITRFKQAGHAAIMTPVTELLPESQSAVMLYGSSILEGNIEAGNRFMVAYLKAVRQYNQGKTERNLEILIKYMQLEPELMKDMCWPTIREDGSLNLASLQDFQDWSVKMGLAEQSLPSEQIVDTRSLDYANEILNGSD